MSTKINKEIYLSDSNIQLKQIETNKTDISNINNFIKNKLIYQSGSNFIKYEDGTLIVYEEHYITYDIYDMWSWCDRTLLKEIKFPVAFITPPTVILTSKTFCVISMNVDSVSKDKFTFYGFQPKNCNQKSLNCYYIAIGKWK